MLFSKPKIIKYYIDCFIFLIEIINWIASVNCSSSARDIICSSILVREHSINLYMYKVLKISDIDDTHMYLLHFSELFNNINPVD